MSLETQAAYAGLALACAYSNSDEYEAALIKTRRDAGVYGGKRHQRRALMAVAATAALLFLVGGL